MESIREIDVYGSGNIVQPHEQFLPQIEFCRRVGITQDWAKKLRDRGILPSFGRKPAYIPLYAGARAIADYTREKAAERRGQTALRYR